MRKKCLVVAMSALMILGASINVYADQSYSQYWETQADGSWRYKLTSGGYASGWIQDEVDHNWYFMDSNGIMQSGVYKSYSKLYLLSEQHDGHFGHLVKSGETYRGITIQASTSADDEGALSQTTINQLRSAGLNVDSVPDISGSQHVTGGQVTSGGNTSQNNDTGSSLKVTTAAEKVWDTNGDGYLTGDEYTLYKLMKDADQNFGTGKGEIH